MKKNKLLFFALLIGATQANAQLTLTKAANEPIAGDVYTTQSFDSVNVVPKNIGQNQTWNFSAIVQTTDSPSSTNYIAASTVPASSLFPGATLAVQNATNYFDFYKSGNSQFEYLGYDDVGAIVNFTNTNVLYAWPVAYGYSNTDIYGGPASGAANGTRTGTYAITATGSGTITLPGGHVYTNVLQVKLSQTDIQADASSTLTITETEYAYYHSSQKFPILGVGYITLSSGTASATFADVFVNHNVATGIAEHIKELNLSVYPNPAKGSFTFNLNNANNQQCSVQLCNTLGQVVKNLELGNNSTITTQVNVADVPAGIYFIKTKLGTGTDVRKIVIE